MPRRKHDFYETAPWQVDALVENLPELSGRIFCPCVGDGSLLDHLSALLPDATFVTNDLDTAHAADYHFDATCSHGWGHLFEHDPLDWVVENFPFKVEHQILPHALAFARKGVVAMARISFVEPTKGRGEWLAAHPHDKRIVLERYSFTRNGKSDMATTEWLVWAEEPLAGPFGVSAYGYRPTKGQQ
jgi:hypothetical protein